MYALKIAGQKDPAAFARFTGKLRPGDGVNFNASPHDKMEKSLVEGLSGHFVSTPIKKFQGSDDSHTGMHLGIDNEGGGAQLLHNTADGFKGTRVQPLADFADDTSLTGFRPRLTSKRQNVRAAAQALHNHTTTPPGYPTKNLALAGLDKLLQKSPLPAGMKERGNQLLNNRAQVCPPGQGLCSQLLPDAYAGQMGADTAAKLFGVESSKKRLGLTPATVRAASRDVASYVPANPAKPSLKPVVNHLGKAFDVFRAKMKGKLR